MARIKSTISYSGLIKKQYELEKNIKHFGAQAVNDTIDLVKLYALEYAPDATGRLKSFIKAFKVNDIRSIGYVEAQNPTLNPPKSYRGGSTKFNLVRWMHESPRAYSIIHRGEPQFMYKAAEKAEKEGIKLAQKTFNKINIR